MADDQDALTPEERKRAKRRERYLRNLEQNRAYGRAYAAANRDKMRASALASYYRRLAEGTFVRHRNPAKDKEYRKRNRARESARAIAWARSNPERTREILRNWRKANPEKSRAWAKSNPDRVKEIQREWGKKNKAKRNVNTNNRRARKLAASGAHTASDLAKIRRQQKDRCAYCRCRLHGKGQVDHIVPLARGGTNDRRNLQYLCSTCNQRKNAKDPLVYARTIGLLL